MVSSRYMIRLSFITSLFLLSVPCNLFAGGLSTQLGEVVIENLQIGEQYNLYELANLRLPVTNKSDVAVHLKLDVVTPGESELKMEAETIPDASWLQLSDSLFLVEAGETIYADLSLRIPDDVTHLGKKYQVMVWSHTVPGDESGMFLAYGLKSRIIFTIDPNQVENNNTTGNSTGAVSFLLEPDELRIPEIQLGEEFLIGGSSSLSFVVTNDTKKRQTFQVRSIPEVQSPSLLASGYSFTPDPSYLSFKESEIVLEPDASKSLDAVIMFPEKTEYKNKKYMFIVHVFNEGDMVTSGKYSRIYLTTR